MITWERIKELQNEIGADGFDEVLDLFLDEVEEALGGLHADLSPSEQERTCHFLKGSALNLGFSDLANLCASAEKSAAQGQPVQVEPIHQSYSDSKTHFLSERAMHLMP